MLFSNNSFGNFKDKKREVLLKAIPPFFCADLKNKIFFSNQHRGK
jgi:hypothetical protein